MEKVAAYEDAIWDDILEKEARNRFNREMDKVKDVISKTGVEPKFQSGRMGQAMRDHVAQGRGHTKELFLRSVMRGGEPIDPRWQMTRSRKIPTPSKKLGFTQATHNTGLSLKTVNSLSGRKERLAEAIAKNKDPRKQIPQNLSVYFN